MKFTIFFTTLFALAICSYSSPIEPEIENAPVLIDSKQTTVNYRLPTDVKPQHYELELTPYFDDDENHEDFTFDGWVSIKLQATVAQVDKIILHMNDLIIKDWRLVDAQLPSTTVASGLFVASDYEAITHFWTIPIRNQLGGSIYLDTARQYTLIINYSGYLREDMNGFYRSYYYEDGIKYWMASTQFQMTEARRCFPNFDEPSFKATFQVTMNRPSSFTTPTLSNTMLSSQPIMTPSTGRWTDKFNITPVMSSYLLAFMVTNYKGRQTSDGKFGVFGPPSLYANTQYAFDYGQENLKNLGKYLGIDYYSIPGYEKMDIASVPDFQAGAMENIGLNTFREASSLYDGKSAQTVAKQRIAAVIAHEFAHQWFGDLATCSWWSHTWLNEGFARYFQYFGTEMNEPNWQLEEQFVVEQLQGVFQLDGTDGTHPMTHDVNTPSEVSGIFDNISYNKGGTIIRMLKHMIGGQAFAEVLHNYLDNNRFRATTPDDLWTALRTIVPFNSTNALNYVDLIAPWTDTPGYPLVTASIEGRTLTLTQKRFLVANMNHSDNTLYNIPITFGSNGTNFGSIAETTPKFYFEITKGNSMTYQMPEAERAYTILNVQQTGYYRVNYDKENWDAIRLALKTENHDNIHLINRAQIVDDLLNMARPGVVSYEDALDIIMYLKDEKNYIPWLSAFTGLGLLQRRMASDEDSKLFGNYILDMVENIYKHLGYDSKETDSHTDSLNRVNVLNWACKYNHDECVDKAVNDFNRFLNSGYEVPADKRVLVYCNGIRNGNDAQFNNLMKRYKDGRILPLPMAEQLNMLQGLACTKSEANLHKYLKELVLTEEIRRQDKSAAFTYAITSNIENNIHAYNFITQNHKDWLIPSPSLTSALSSIAGRFTTNDEISKLETFGTSTDSLGAAIKADIVKYVANARSSVEWDQTYVTAVREYLKKMGYASASPVSMSLTMTMFTLTLVYLFQQI